MRGRANPVVVLLVLVLAACGGHAEGGEARAWLTRVEAAHHAATTLLLSGDADAAQRALVAAVDLTPPGRVSARDARVLRQDLLYRLTELDLLRNRPHEAEIWADRGLALGEASDIFTANLLIARGRARQVQDHATAASRDYHAALIVSEALLEASLGGSRDSR